MQSCHLHPFANWRRQHAQHHAGWNNLDTRPGGIDMYSSCLTVREYLSLSRFERLRYRILYHPVVALVVLPPLIFLLLYRLPFDTPVHGKPNVARFTLPTCPC